MKNILFIVPDFYPNSTGFANAAFNLTQAITKYGKDKYNVGVFCSVQLGNNKEVNGIEVVRYINTLPDNRITHGLVERKKYNALKNFIARFKPDVLFFETNTFPFLESWIVRDYQDKVFVRIHSTADTEVPIFGEHKSLLDKIEFNKIKDFMVKAPNIISTSNYYIEFIKKYYLEGNVYSIWNNKSYNVLYNTSGDMDTSIQVQNQNIFMTMGKMSDNGVTQKGITDLLKAVYSLKRANRIPEDFKLIIVGTGTKVESIKKMINNLGLIQHINLIERASHDEVFELIRNSKAIILLSRYEGQSMFITESISLGKPLILSDNNGMQDMLMPNVNGFKVKTGDLEMAASAITSMIDLSVDDLRSFSQASLDLYLSKFSSEAVYNQFDQIMELHFSQF